MSIKKVLIFIWLGELIESMFVYCSSMIMKVIVTMELNHMRGWCTS